MKILCKNYLSRIHFERIKNLLVSLLVLLAITACSPPVPDSLSTIERLEADVVSTDLSEATITAKSQEIHNDSTINELISLAVASREELDIKQALSYFDQAELLIEDKSISNKEYWEILVLKSQTYSYFERLDEAETTLLIATGIPLDTIDSLTNSRKPLSESALLAIATDIQKMVTESDLSGYHVALSLIYNILGKQETLDREQQAGMDVSTDKDMTLVTAMELYKIRGRKQEVNGALTQQRKIADENPDDLVEQYYLAMYLYLNGWFPEAQEVTDYYLASIDPDLDKENYLNFLFLKMNIEMGLGNFDSMKAYKAKILDIDPTAFSDTQ